MNINDFRVGQTASISKSFCLNDDVLFSQLSLDINPVHIDEQYAKKTFFKNNIVHGFLVGSIISAVIANKLPGPGAIYLHQTMNFIKPVFHNDIITATVEVTKIRLDKSILFLNTVCHNEKGEIVIEGNAVVKLLNN